MADYVVSHFNYWAAIVLMMVGLYTVFASGNMVKRLVGLGVFQTSVFLFYISMGKVTGGIPPILPENHGAGAGDESHGAAHQVAESAGGAEHGAESAIPEGLRGSSHGDGASAVDAPDAGALDAGAADLSSSTSVVGELNGEGVEHAAVAHAVDALPLNEAVAGPVAGPSSGPVPHAGGAAPEASGAHAAIEPLTTTNGATFSASALDQVYSNPLPHVLILTAIVVGVATLAVGLALVVLIREAYGTIEDDDISRAEYDAEVTGADA